MKALSVEEYVALNCLSVPMLPFSVCKRKKEGSEKRSGEQAKRIIDKSGKAKTSF